MEYIAAHEGNKSNENVEKLVRAVVGTINLRPCKGKAKRAEREYFMTLIIDGLTSRG